MADGSDLLKTSPLQGMVSPGTSGSSGGITLAEAPFVGKVNIRGNADDPAFTAAVATVLGVQPPLEPNTVASHGAYTAFWLGPDEWLIHTPVDGEETLIGALHVALGDQHVAVTNVSDYYVVIRMRGGKSADVLARACPLDLHPRAFPAGSCAQTVFAHASILVHQVEGGYDIQVRWTYAQYLWNYFAEAAENLAA